MEIVFGIIAGAFNGVGALLIFLKKTYSEKELNRYLNTAAGIMLAAAFFSLLCPAYGRLSAHDESGVAAVIFCGGVLCGYLFLGLLDFIVPHLHRLYDDKQKSVVLFALAVALHKIPEGLAMGVAYADNPASGEALTLGILLQNIPEGLAVALSLLSAGYVRKSAVLTAALTGLTQPAGMLFGLVAGVFNRTFVYFCMAFAGSALLFVVINEVLPQSYRTQKDLRNSGALFAGFLLMSFISILL